jgi:multidrug efflux pump subunit AcrA (membrane-fusion protein)
VVNDKDVVEQRPVETGDAIDGGMRIIKSGLSEKDRVVVNGIQRAFLAAPSSRSRLRRCDSGCRTCGPRGAP